MDERDTSQLAAGKIALQAALLKRLFSDPSCADLQRLMNIMRHNAVTVMFNLAMNEYAEEHRPR